jgi:heme oxygenase
MSRLRTATGELQYHLELAAESGPSQAIDRHRRFLARMYGFHAPLERRLRLRTDLVQVLPDLVQRQRADRIAHDLIALGVPPEDVDELPRCHDLPDLPDVAAALGCVYIIEVVGGADDDRDHCWRAFVAAVEHHARTRAVADRVVSGALETLTRLVDWLVPVTSAPRA